MGAAAFILCVFLASWAGAESLKVPEVGAGTYVDPNSGSIIHRTDRKGLGWPQRVPVQSAPYEAGVRPTSIGPAAAESRSAFSPFEKPPEPKPRPPKRCSGKKTAVEDLCVDLRHRPSKRRVALSGFSSLYAPSVLRVRNLKVGKERVSFERMWLGGWLSDADEGPSRIYVSQRMKGRWTRPAPVFSLPGLHVHDPSVIRHPTRDMLLMYYTVLEVGAPAESHAIGLATSLDGGLTWSDFGVVIAPEDSGDAMGAWSPSAVVVGDEIRVYYHTANRAALGPIDYMQRFGLGGWKRKGEPERLEFVARDEERPVLLAHLDVKREGLRFVMTAGSLSLGSIFRYVSKDGLLWAPDPYEPVVSGGEDRVLTPCLELLGGGRYRVYFGYARGAGSEAVLVWDF